MKCNFCGSYNSSIISEWTRYEKNNILKCSDCGLVFMETQSSKNEIEFFYKKKYRKLETLPVLTAEEHYNSKVSRRDVDQRIKFITENVNLEGKKVLEIGSASGGLLESLRNAGADVKGIELNDEYREYSEKLGFNVLHEPIDKLKIKEIYDIIISFHTIEHFVDAKSAFISIFAALIPDGVFLGEVPNQDDWRISIFNDDVTKRFHYDPNHYYYFSPVTLKNYLENCGFSKIKLDTVERYNSILQLKNILCDKYSIDNIENILNKYIFPAGEKEDVRLRHLDDRIENEFNRIFEPAVNSELKGNCLRFITEKV
ncbi:MAG TPA: class I SAM-dependent methyltransferase [Candidatus Methylomirabilis sp.]|nr:class I SAM-dependent methyltransferase [Candidatus Methylomirabilis sp.]